MIEPTELERLLSAHGMPAWAAAIGVQLQQSFNPQRHGDWERWRYLLDLLPDVATNDLDLRADWLRIGRAGMLDDDVQSEVLQVLRALQPWRKGPYEVFGIHINSEWRSDMKWQRLLPHIQPLEGRTVLDVGCGNGYHCWRMAGEGAALVLGIDPNLLFLSQFMAIRKLMASPPAVHLLPLGIEAVPAGLKAFDSVFSMGVLYHRRSPIEHLMTLRDCLREGGELVLETLVIEGDAQTVLVPSGRYAKMRNVWFIPSPAALTRWLQRAGFDQVRVVDVTSTSTDEQRATDWMQFESLADFLDPNDSNRTLEGYPAPCRAVVLATA